LLSGGPGGVVAPRIDGQHRMLGRQGAQIVHQRREVITGFEKH